MNRLQVYVGMVLVVGGCTLPPPKYEWVSEGQVGGAYLYSCRYRSWPYLWSQEIDASTVPCPRMPTRTPFPTLTTTPTPAPVLTPTRTPPPFSTPRLSLPSKTPTVISKLWRQAQGTVIENTCGEQVGALRTLLGGTFVEIAGTAPDVAVFGALPAGYRPSVELVGGHLTVTLTSPPAVPGCSGWLRTRITVDLTRSPTTAVEVYEDQIDCHDQKGVEHCKTVVHMPWRAEPDTTRQTEEYADWASGFLPHEITAPDPATRRRLAYLDEHPELDERTLTAIMQGKFFLGMTAEEVQASIGAPSHVNKTVFAWGISEQWEYGDLLGGGRVWLLYFDDGVLTSWQEY